VNTTELIAAVRVAGGLPSVDVTYTGARVLVELSEAQVEFFTRMPVESREGYLLKQYTVPTVAAQPYYRLPRRSVMQTAERVEIFESGRWQPLGRLTTVEASAYSGTESGPPDAYTVRGDSLQLFPTPSGVLTLRIHYYLRPSTLVLPQDDAEGEAEGVKGLIEAIAKVDASTWTLTLNDDPDDQLTAAAVAEGDLVDIVRSDTGDVVAVDLVRTGTGVTGDASLAQVGDYLRAAGQSEWPQLPVDLHRTLADATAAVIQLGKGMDPAALASKVQSDLERLFGIANPRVKDSPGVIVGRSGLARRAARRGR
jgi:hypothetical protein